MYRVILSSSFKGHEGFRPCVRTSIIVFGLWLCIAATCFGHSYSVPEHNKRHVWRITNPDGQRGTGFVLSDSVAGFFLVTNKHVVTSPSTGQYYDSVTVFINIITNSNKVMSTDSSVALYLRKGGRDLFVKHDSADVDLVFIQLGSFNGDGKTFTNPKGIDWIIGFSTSMILDTKSATVNAGAIIQMIGYSLKLPQTAQFTTSRFGCVSSYAAEKIHMMIDGKMRESEWIIVDASVRPGHSGGPAFSSIEHSEKLTLIGFVQAMNMKSELSYVIPSHYILDLLKKVRALMQLK